MIISLLDNDKYPKQTYQCMLNIKNGLVLYGPELEPMKANILIEDNYIVEVSADASGGREIDAKDA